MDQRASGPEDWPGPRPRPRPRPAARDPRPAGPARDPRRATGASDLRPRPGAPGRQSPGSSRAASHGGRHAARRTGSVRRSGATTPGALRVPEITGYFWIIKGLSTAVGESTSDFLVHAMNPVVAVGLGFVGFVIALALQFSVRRYIAWTYWFAVLMVGVFGTMAADVLHVGFGVPYIFSAVLYAIALAAVFLSWQRTEKTLSIHSIDTPRREAFYWAAVVATFAMGTALGDLTAITLHLGYFRSLVLFAVMITIPASGYRWLRWNPILSFWLAYVITRPLGASFADWVGKPVSVSGLGLGNGRVSVVLTIMIACLVGYLAVTRRDVQRRGI